MSIVVCIPTTLNSYEELRDSLIQSTDGKYIMAGGIIMNTDTSESFVCEFCEYDPNMRGAFESSSQGRFSEGELVNIENHKSILYLTYKNTGLDNLHHLHNIINICLSIGGIGLKFENSGLSHSKKLWNSYNFHEDTLQLLNSHIMYIHDKNYTSSVGMHIFGLSDISVSSLIENPIYLLTEFNHYHLFESPTFNDGNTFSLSEDEPKFKVRIKEDFVYEGEGCFENPFGRLLLECIEPD